MKFFYKCVSVFFVTALLFALGDQFIFDTTHSLSITLLIGITIGVVVAVIFGWITEVYVKHERDF